MSNTLSDTPERWLPVVGWEDAYAVSSWGRIRNIRTGGKGRRARSGYLIASANRRGGYLHIGLSRHGKTHTKYVHMVVATAFLSPRPDGMVIRHKDGDVSNNCASNLVYGTSSQNITDEVRHGTHAHARKTHCANGHEFTPENTYRRPSQPTFRDCLACERDRRRNRGTRKIIECPSGAVSAADAALLLGINRGTFYVFRQRYDDFPVPTKVGPRLFFLVTELSHWRAVHPQQQIR